ncbi:MAG: hypothetical protein VSS52_012895, partial [Thiotrichaceae bacterium]|nr:hypothetical protein [Thiotrichaceae bacterium]
MFVSVLLKASTLLTFVVTIHAVLVWILLLQPKPIPVKQRPIQISFIQLQKPVQKPITKQANVLKVAATTLTPKSAKKPRNSPKINKSQKKTKSKAK